MLEERLRIYGKRTIAAVQNGTNITALIREFALANWQPHQRLPTADCLALFKFTRAFVLVIVT
jgi:hypothetical protein